MFTKFIVAMLADWLALISGIGGLILLVVGTFWFSGAVPRWTVLLVAQLCFLYSLYRIWVRERKQVLRLRTRDVEISIGDTKPYVQHDGKSTIVRVGVRNISAKTIARLQVDLTAMEPCTITEYLPLTMRQTGEWYGPLDPGAFRMIDVAYRNVVSDDIEVLPKKQLDQRICMPSGTYRITVWARGQDCGKGRDLILSVNECNELCLRDAPENRGLFGHFC